MSSYIWKKDATVKDLNLEVIRQALLKADDANLVTLAPYQAFPMYFDDTVAADDANCDKASLRNARRSELMRSTDSVHKQQDNNGKAKNLESRVPEAIESPSKRIRQETRRESDGESEAEEIQEVEKAQSSNASDGQPSVEHWKNECILSIEEWLTPGVSNIRPAG